MGRLSGLKFREVVKRLRKFGYEYDRQGPGSHEIWRNPATGAKVSLPHHSGDMAEGTLRAVLKEAGISVEAFLESES
jgi:predicted RNA binding protein YcfA (HicA-like mRNA interferase family)